MIKILCATWPLFTIISTSVWLSMLENLNRKSIVKLTLLGKFLKMDSALYAFIKIWRVTLIAPLLKAKSLLYAKGGLKQKYVCSIKIRWTNHSGSLKVIYGRWLGMRRRLRIKHYLKHGFSCRLSTHLLVPYQLKEVVPRWCKVPESLLMKSTAPSHVAYLQQTYMKVFRAMKNTSQWSSGAFCKNLSYIL